jgi:hypothetical protein
MFNILFNLYSFTAFPIFILLLYYLLNLYIEDNIKWKISWLSKLWINHPSINIRCGILILVSSFIALIPVYNIAVAILAVWSMLKPTK